MGGHPTKNFPVKVYNERKNKKELFKGALVQHQEAEV